jgi:hypothetical protein
MTFKGCRKRGDLSMLPMTRVLATLCALTMALAMPAPAAITRTTVVTFNPWASGGLQRGFTVLEKAKGSCWTRSLSTDRPDAWRCFQGNDIHDPCFAASGSTIVACAEDPFSKRVVLLRLSKPLADGGNPTTKMLQPKGEPWGLLLMSGDRCIFATGATDVVAGERMNYACAKNGWVIGAPDRSTAIWTARSVDWPNKHVTLVRITTAVF